MRSPGARRAVPITIALLLLCYAILIPVRPVNAQELPDLGGAGGGLFSTQHEAAIADQVMRSLRLSTPMLRDPLLQDYLRTVVYNLVPYAPLETVDLTLVIIDDPAINAFAVPGGIIGVNAGLFRHAETEQQFVSVLAHELAHLSQRHFARRMAQQQQAAPMALAGMVAGIILSAVTQSDIGLAAIAGSQALAIQNMLQYSRANEQEADRMGLEILAKAGYDPRAMPRMFEHMLQRARLQGNRPPEYLSTHPLTESRIADTQNRAVQYPATSQKDSVEYHLMRARVLVRYAASPEDAIAAFRQEIRKTAHDTAALEYGLAVALMEDDKPHEAIELLESLLRDDSGRISLIYTLAAAELEAGQIAKASARLEAAINRNPGNLPLQQKLGEALMEQGRPEAAARMFETLTRALPLRADIWHALADAQIEARNIVAFHRARAEYELLMNNPDRAQMHLREAIKRARNNPPLSELLRNRLQAAELQSQTNRSAQ